MFVRLTEVMEGREQPLWVNASMVAMVQPFMPEDDDNPDHANTEIFLGTGASACVKETPEEVLLLLRIESCKQRDGKG